MDIKALIRDIPDFPKEGILFRDITTLLQDAAGFKATIDALVEKSAPFKPDYIVGMESRGFLFGTPMAYLMNAGFVPVRKPGKLPHATYAVEYALEYGTDRLEIHQDAFPAGARVLIVDDVIATGGTAAATAELVKKCGGELVGFGFLSELTFLDGRSKLPNVPIVTLIEY
jgi:adenine phosphoribosyltransferase